MMNLEEVRNFWCTSQSEIVMPSRYINKKAKAPMGTLMAISMKSSIGQRNLINGTDNGKGSRILSINILGRVYKRIKELRDNKTSDINRDIKKLLEYDTKEFYIKSKLKENTENEYINYIEMDYSDGFVKIELEVAHELLKYSDSVIQAYIILKWVCRNGWAQLTREQMAEHMGLSRHSHRKATKVINTLVEDGFIEMRTGYRDKVIFDKKTKTLKSITTPFYEYQITGW